MERIALWLLIALVSGCATSQPQKLWDASAMAALPYSTVFLKERKDGKISAKINMADIQKMIQIKERLETAAGPLHTKLYLAEGNEPNGFSAVTHHGPIIAINIGMLNLIGQDGDAMAALMGHELAHLYLNHGNAREDREENRVAASIALTIGLGMLGVPVPFELTDFATSSASSKFSRDDEREADTLGVKYMVHAGFDPFGSVRLQEKLGAASKGSLLPFLSSHPSSSERVENMKRLAKEIKPARVAPPPEEESGLTN